MPPPLLSNGTTRLLLLWRWWLLLVLLRMGAGGANASAAHDGSESRGEDGSSPSPSPSRQRNSGGVMLRPHWLLPLRWRAMGVCVLGGQSSRGCRGSKCVRDPIAEQHLLLRAPQEARPTTPIDTRQTSGWSDPVLRVRVRRRVIKEGVESAGRWTDVLAQKQSGGRVLLAVCVCCARSFFARRRVAA